MMVFLICNQSLWMSYQIDPVDANSSHSSAKAQTRYVIHWRYAKFGLSIAWVILGASL